MIPFVDLDRIHAPLRSELDTAIAAVVDSGDFILGPDLERFEADFAGFLGVGHVVGVGSGTAALELALRALGVGPGDEVIVPAHTYIATALGVVHAGATPVFCDVDEHGLVDLASAEEVCGERTAAIIPVHLYGQVCDMDALGALASRRGLALVEDAAQAHGGRWDERRAGSFGEAGAFSFYPSKNLGAFGDGGAVATDSDDVADRLRRLRNLGQLAKGDHEIAGYNHRLHSLQAAVLRVKLPHLDHHNGLRSAAARRYRQRLPVGAATPPARERASDVHHLMPVRVADRDAVRERLAAAGVGTGIHYAPAVCDQPPFAESEERTDLSRARAWAASELSLPMFPLLGDDEVDVVCEQLERALSG